MTLVKKALAIMLTLLLVTPEVAQSWQNEAGYLYLTDRLDRLEDGYCLDVAGSSDWVDFNMPLNAHNCKRPGFYADEGLCCTNRVKDVLPLSPDGFSLRAR